MALTHCSCNKGLKPEIIPSDFPEDLPKTAYAQNLAEYPVATVSLHNAMLPYITSLSIRVDCIFG